ncbi:MAG: hypothetical protein U0271_26660 [Polyangiaceae bacterium]
MNLTSSLSEPHRFPHALCWFVLACATAACGPSVGAASASDGRRHPDGVAVDPPEIPPEAVDRADTSDGVIALRTPLGVEAARETAAEFMQAIGREDTETMRKLLSSDAMSINPSTHVRENTQYFFARRFSRLDYFQLAVVSYFQEETMELYRSSEAQGLWSDSVGATATPSPGTPSINNDALENGDVIVRVPVTTSRLGATQLLGDEVTLLMRRSGGRFVVHRVVEDFQLN